MKTQSGRRNRERRPQESENGNEERLANGLGWFSIGLGVAEVIAPQKVAELIGVRDKEGTRALLRAYGLREIAAGIGILSQTRPAGWMWSRVAGDLLDLASLGSALSSDDSNRTRVGLATAAVLGVTALDVLCGQQLSRDSGDQTRVKPAAKNSGGQVTKTIVINRPPDEVYRFWRDFERLPSFMDYLESVQVTGEQRSHWKAKGPAGTTFEWDAETVDDEPNTRISWRSLEGSEIHNSGTVRFERAPGGRGTLLRVELQYAPPGGAISANIAKLFGADPGQHLEHDLRVLRQILETGEVVKSDASIHKGKHPAQPAEKTETQDSLAKQGRRELSFA
jgi:uncharacterized membrane protein